ncbi:DNA replication complex GINS protein SLD5 [Halotydeus destructor]|nr:DNA replication complex GINS protein SLD5 [Halotydeus destructor]
MSLNDTSATMVSASQGPSQSQVESQEEYETPYQVYRRLVEVVLNETIAPELLPYEEAIVECIVDQVQHMGENIKKFGKKLDSFCVEQHRIELERFSYVVNKYYRTRLEKMESSSSALIKLLQNDREKAANMMSSQEMKYLDNYVSSIDGHFADTVLKHLPDNMKSFKLTDISTNDKHEFDANYVFVKAAKKTSVIVDDPLTGPEVVNMDKGAQHFLPYSSVRSSLQNGSKDLLLL